MDKSRRKKRKFNTEPETKDIKESFKFPLEMEDALNNSVTDRHKSDSEPLKNNAFTNYPRHSMKDLKKEKYSYTISKARDIPSAIHGTHKKLNRTEIKHHEETDRYEELESLDNISSVIIRDIVKERNRKKKKANERARKEALRLEREKKRYDDPYSLKSAKQILTSKQKEDTSKNEPVEEVVSEATLQKQLPEAKRQGPSFSLPSLHMLGQGQKVGYDSLNEDLKVTMVKAFEAIGVPAHVHQYKSNGIIGRFEMKLDRNFRISHVSKLKEYLLPHLPWDDIRVVAPIIGTSNIGIEVPVLNPVAIPFSTLFDKSSLKLRRNDHKYVIGKTVDDHIFSYELSKTGHILLFGGADSDAKNVIEQLLMSMFMNHTPHEFKVFFAVDNEEKFKEYQNLPYLFDEEKFLSDENVLKTVFDELIERQNQFRRAHVRNINSFNQRVDYASKKPVLTVILDDFTSLYQHKNTEANKMIGQILKKGKPLGIHLIIRHSINDDKIRYDLLQMVQTRISFYDEKDQVIEGSSELVEGNDMLVQIPTSNKPIRVNAGTLAPDIKEKVLTHIKKYKY
jgi:S-DNA-T family DNA segregation ATPase FtsK/SpoIIIE